jgi:hypothetical protein
MKSISVPMAVRRSGIVGFAVISLVAICWPHMCPAAVPSEAEQQQIKTLIGAYYRAVADENVEEVVSLFHCENSVEREELTALVEQAFTIADSEFYAVRVSKIDVYPQRGLGLARVGVEYTIKRFDGGDGYSGHLDAAVVLIRGSNGWRIGKVGRAADFDLTAAASQYVAKTQELEETVPQAPAGVVEPPPTNSKLPKLAAARPPVPQASPAGNNTAAGSSAAAGTSAGLTFYALRRKASGKCEVVAGAEGISPGDTVIGGFADFRAAQEALEASCDRGEAAASAESPSKAKGGPLTNDRLYDPDEKVTRGAWGSVTRIAGEGAFANATDAGQPVDDGFFVHPGSEGPTEIVYQHDGSSATLQGRATVIDCVGYCGGAGTVTFAIEGDGRELWNSGLVRHGGPGRIFAVQLEGVSEIRLKSTDGGNGIDEDWAAWVDLRVGEGPAQQAPLAATAPEARFDGRAILAIPRYRADESTAGAFVVDLSDGSAAFVDRVGIGGNTYRSRALNVNIFTVLGRPKDRPAKPGEILVGEIRSTSGAVTGLFLVETSTGAAAYLSDLGNEPHRATYRPVNGRPAAAIASDDGNFALVMRRDGSGATDGAYLYHASSGQCVYFAHVDEMHSDPEVQFTTPMPKLDGRVAALPLQNGGEATPQGLLLDEATGTIFKVGGLERDPTQISATRQNLELFEFFPDASPRSMFSRFVLVPGYSSSGAADAVFVVDAGSGRMAVLKDVRTGGAMRLVGSTKSLVGYIPGVGSEGRALAAVPKVGTSGTTDGAWIFDAAMEGVLVLENVRGPHNLKIRKIDRAVH